VGESPLCLVCCWCPLQQCCALLLALRPEVVCPPVAWWVLAAPHAVVSCPVSVCPPAVLWPDYNDIMTA